ncbi:MAG: tetratricopeptide repeat protein [Devosia sp.]
MRGAGKWLTSLAVALSLTLPALADPAVVSLGGNSAAAPSSPEEWVAACGDLAASPFEAGRDGRGVAEDKDLFLEAAGSTCEEAVQQNPDSAAAATWLGRVYLQIGRGPDAVLLLESAAAADNPYAKLLLSGVLADPYAYGTNGDFDRSILLRAEAAEVGFAPAQVALAKAYEAGTESEPNFEEAYRLYDLAGQQNHPYGLFKTAFNYHVGMTVTADYAEAMRLYQQASDLGSSDGLNGVAQLYEFGQGVAQDYGKAAEFHLRAAEAGSAASQAELGYFYEQGFGVEKDLGKSVEWLEKSAGQGYPYGEASLAIHLLFGQGVAVDLERGYQLAEASAAQGSVLGESILGFLYAQGVQVERDLSAAMFHFRAAADQGDTYSQNWIPVIEAELACATQAGSQYEPGLVEDGRNFDAINPDAAIPACEAALSTNQDSPGDKAWLARAYLAGGRVEQAMPLLEDAAAAGNVLGQTLLGYALRQGAGTAEDLPRSLDLFNAAAAEDFEPAMFALGEAYQDAIGVDADPVAAQLWFRKAANGGMTEATERLAEIEGGDGNGVATAGNGFGKEGLVPY